MPDIAGPFVVNVSRGCSVGCSWCCVNCGFAPVEIVIVGGLFQTWKRGRKGKLRSRNVAAGLAWSNIGVGSHVVKRIGRGQDTAIFVVSESHSMAEFVSRGQHI